VLEGPPTKLVEAPFTALIASRAEVCGDLLDISTSGIILSSEVDKSKDNAQKYIE
jgi:hypothetical protein